MPPGVETPVSGGRDSSIPRIRDTSVHHKTKRTKKERQKKDVVAQDLEIFGIAKSAATKLMHDYPVEYIKEKLEMAKRLVAAGSALVSQNPAGWLRKAIEEDYAPPRTYERHRHRSVREKKDAKLVQAEPRERNMPKVRSQQAQNVPNEPTQNVTTEPRESKGENKEPEKTSRENEITWKKTLEQLQGNLSPGEAAARLTGTTLLQVTDTAALIGVPSTFAIAWLERRLYGQISKAIKCNSHNLISRTMSDQVDFQQN
jgi:hypothetical protein